MPIFPTGNAFVDTIEGRASANSGQLLPGPQQAVALFCALCLAADDRSFTITIFNTANPTGQVVAVSSGILSLMGVADLAAFNTLRAQAGWVHPKDVSLAMTNTANKSFAPHTLRLRRNDGVYRRIVVNSFWATIPLNDVGDLQPVRISCWKLEET